MKENKKEEQNEATAEYQILYSTPKSELQRFSVKKRYLAIQTKSGIKIICPLLLPHQYEN